MEIHFYRITEAQKQALESNKQFDYQHAFAEIDDWNYGFIDPKNLKVFMRKHGVIMDMMDIMAIIRRMDLDGDARISKEEFIQGMMPE